jgi:hypothetical protein
MTDLPAPPIPAEVDLTDFAFMPMEVRRVRDSRFAATATGEEFMAGMLLWCASWHQIPAGSLPDDDIQLANLAGFGRVVKVFRKIRKGALYGWTKHSDGRLYHPVVVEKALESWESKLRNAYSKMHERIRKANKQRSDQQLTPLVIPSFEDWKATGRVDPVPPEGPKLPPEFPKPSAGIPKPPSEPSAGNPPENALKGEQGTGRIRDRDIKPVPEGARPSPASEGKSEPGSEGQPHELGADFESFLRATYPKTGHPSNHVAAQKYATGLLGLGLATEEQLRQRLKGFRAFVDGGGYSDTARIPTSQAWFKHDDPRKYWAHEWEAPAPMGTPKPELTWKPEDDEEGKRAHA